MDASLKKILKSVTLELRHLLEGHFDTAGTWYPGDLEDRLASIGVRRDREPRPMDELALPTEDLHARKVVDAYLKRREESGVKHCDAVVEFLRETAYTWANRLIALRCMESRELIDSVILQQDAYGGRSLEHHRLAQRQPELCAGEDDGLFAVLDKVFREQTKRLPMLFDSQAPGIALRPSPAAIKDCFGLLSLNLSTLQKYRIRIREDENALPDAEPANPFMAPDALGWTYQYWNTEEKGRVFEKVRTVKGTKIAGADIVPATQLYTEDYMVKFLVQNSLGATWMAMHPNSTLSEHWEYYVRDADRAPAALKPVRAITFLDPACGSGHFLIEAFDLYYVMYLEEGELTEPEEICTAILTQNLFGIDIDARAVQIAEAALWMKAAERSFDYSGAATNLVAATASHLKGPAWEEFLTTFTKEPSIGRVLRKFAQTMEHIDEIGSLARPAEDLQAIIHEEHATWEQQVREQKEANFLFPEMRKEALSGQLAFNEISDEEFGDRLFYRARAGIDAFTEKAREAGEFDDQMLASETRTGFRLLEVLSNEFDVVAANPPYMSVYSMGDALRKWISVAYPETYYDLFSALLERGTLLTTTGGCVAFVAQSSFLTIRNYTALRELLLDRAVPRLVADLGTGAFADISGAKVNVLLYVGRGIDAHRTARFLDVRGAEHKAEKLSRDVSHQGYQVVPESFRQIARTPFIYSMPTGIRRLLTAEDSIAEYGQAYLGLKTANNAKFCRMEWEVRRSPSSGERPRWKRLVSETNSSPYYSDTFSVVSFRDADVTYFRHHVSAQVYNRSLWGRAGLTFGAAAGRGFDVKLLDASSMVLNSSNLMLLHDPSVLMFLTGVMNTSLFRVLMNLLNPTINNTPGDVHRLPWPKLHPTGRQAIEVAVLQIIESIKFHRRIETESEHFDLTTPEAGSLAEFAQSELRKQFNSQQQFVRAKGLIEKTVIESLLDASEDLDFVLDWNGVAPCHVIDGGIATHRMITVERIHADCPLEELSIETGAPPHEVTYPAFFERFGREQSVLLAARRIEAICLELIGHTFPMQIGTTSEEIADSDGVMLLTTLQQRGVLYQCVVSRLERQNIDISDFTDVMGSSLETWLGTMFFQHHAKQFKKRPIAWQMQSGSFTARRAPAIACLIYYHKLDSDLLPKVLKMAEDLRKSRETELRGIVTVAPEARSDRQEARRVELEDAIAELQRFEITLESITTTGFGPESVRPKLRQYALDDALLTMKARWLSRLCNLVFAGPLPDWVTAATQAEVHADFGAWITSAMSHFEHYCAQVGPQAPDQSELIVDPKANDLAALIIPEAASMQAKVLFLGCQVWWSRVDEMVFVPLKEQIKQLKAEQKECEATLKSEPEPDEATTRELKARVKELKAEVKRLDKVLKEKTTKAKQVREQIEGWKSDEPATWGEWLAEQPMFDQISSLDHRRPAPKTIAEFIAQESIYAPDINDGVRVNIAPLQKAGILAADVLAAKDLDKAIADRAEWRSDERRWVREGKLPQPGWWPELVPNAET